MDAVRQTATRRRIAKFQWVSNVERVPSTKNGPIGRFSVLPVLFPMETAAERIASTVAATFCPRHEGKWQRLSA